MTFYVPARWTRIAIVPTVVNLSAPTMAELAAGQVINSDVGLDGLSIDRDTEYTDRTPWASPLEVKGITRYSVDVEVSGFRRTQGLTETLWGLCVFKTQSVLVVRRGRPAGLAWAAGQVVETFLFRYGKRNTVGSTGGAVSFSCPLMVSDDRDDAVVAV